MTRTTRMIDNRLCWYWVIVVATLTVTVVDVVEVSYGIIVNINHTEIDVNSISSNQNINLEDFGRLIDFMVTAVKELGVAITGHGPGEKTEEVQRKLLVASEIGELDSQKRALWRNRGDVAGEEVLVLLEYYITNELSAVVKKAETIVDAILEYGIGREKHPLEMVGTYPKDKKGIGVSIGVYVIKFHVFVGSINLEAQNIIVQVYRVTTEEMSFRKVNRGHLSSTMRGLLKVVQNDVPTGVGLKWKANSVEVKCMQKMNEEEIIGPLRSLIYHMVERMCHAAVIGVKEEDATKTPIHVVSYPFQMVITNKKWYKD